MPETGYLAVFLIGLLGGTHCVSMCGGIVGALSMQVQVPGSRPQWPLHLAYNLGRIGSYTAAGAAMETARAAAAKSLDGMIPPQKGE